jgi:hypothetical protein
MTYCKALGWLLIAGALAAGAVEFSRSMVAGSWEAYTFGEAWASISANSLVGFGSLIENQVSPDLWLDVGLPLLNASFWMVLGALGAILLVFCRGRNRGFAGRRRRF